MKDKRTYCIFIKIFIFISIAYFLFNVLNFIFSNYIKKLRDNHYYDVDLY